MTAAPLDRTAELAEAPDLAAVAAAYPLVFAELVQTWSKPDPPATSRAVVERPVRRLVRRPLVLPDAPSITAARPLRQHRGAAALFDEQATAEQLAFERPRR